MEFTRNEKILSNFLVNLEVYIRKFQIEFKISNPNFNFETTAHLLYQLKIVINISTCLRKLSSDNLDCTLAKLTKFMNEMKNKTSLLSDTEKGKNDALLSEMELSKFNGLVSITDSEQYLISVDDRIFEDLSKIILTSYFQLLYICISRQLIRSIENETIDNLFSKLELSDRSNGENSAILKSNTFKGSKSSIIQTFMSDDNISANVCDSNNQNLKENLQQFLNFESRKVLKSCKKTSLFVKKRIFPIFNKKLFKKIKNRKKCKRKVRHHRRNSFGKTFNKNISSSIEIDPIDHLKEFDNTSIGSSIVSLDNMVTTLRKIKTVSSFVLSNDFEKIGSLSQSFGMIKKEVCGDASNLKCHQYSTMTEDISEIPLDPMKQSSNINYGERIKKGSSLIDSDRKDGSVAIDAVKLNPGASNTESNSISDNIFGLIGSQTPRTSRSEQNSRKSGSILKKQAMFNEIPEIIQEKTLIYLRDQILSTAIANNYKKLDVSEVDSKYANSTSVKKSRRHLSSETENLVEKLTHGFIELLSSPKDNPTLRKNNLVVHKSPSGEATRRFTPIFEVKNTCSDFKKWYTVLDHLYGPVIKINEKRDQFYNYKSKFPDIENTLFKKIIDNFPIHPSCLNRKITPKSIMIMVKYFLIFLEELWKFIENCPQHYFITELKDIYKSMYLLFAELSVNIGNTILQMHEYIFLIWKLQHLLETNWLKDNDIRILHRFQIKCQQYYMEETERVMIQYMYIPSQDTEKLKMFKRTQKDRRLWRLENLCNCRIILLQPDSPRSRVSPKGFRTIEIYYDIGRGQPKAAINLLNRLFDHQINTVREGPCIVKFLTGVFVECNRHKWLNVGSPRVCWKDYFEPKDFSYFCQKFKERKTLFGCKIVDNNILFDALKLQNVDYKTVFDSLTWHDVA